MKEEKALLKYQKHPQGIEAFHLLSEVTDEVFLSSRQGQWDNTALSHLPQIHDSFLDLGPMGGILSAMTQYPSRSWLVVACDLPFLDLDTLQNLIEKRDPQKLFTYYESHQDGLPEPLCAIYEDRSKRRLMEALGEGIHCPRKVLLNSHSKGIKLLGDNTLENINHRQEYLNLQKEGVFFANQ